MKKQVGLWVEHAKPSSCSSETTWRKQDASDLAPVYRGSDDAAKRLQADQGIRTYR
jgi:hypothetical protein